jgi:hypothetical protein
MTASRKPARAVAVLMARGPGLMFMAMTDPPGRPNHICIAAPCMMLQMGPTRDVAAFVGVDRLRHRSGKLAGRRLDVARVAADGDEDFGLHGSP